MLIGGLDVGTTGCKLTVYDTEGRFITNEYREYNVVRKNGEHEIDSNIIFESVCEVISKAAKNYHIDAIGVTTFGETFAVLDSNDNVLLPSMLYTDPRGSEEIEILKEKIPEDRLIEISGTKPNQMYSLPKIMWIKNNKPEIYSKIKHILLMEDFIVYMLTGVAAIDYSLAARTMAFDIKQKCWSKEIFDACGIDTSLMSEPVAPGNIAGNIKEEILSKLNINYKIKIINGAHDQVAAALGAGVFEVGDAVDGTGTVECVTPMFDKIPDDKRLYDEGYSVVPYVFENSYVCYALSFTGGAVLKWYRDNFAKYESLLAEKDCKNVYAILDAKVSNEPTDILILPHFAGAANPYMDNSSKAAIVGITLETTEYDIYKALMEGVTYEILTNIEHLEGFGIKFNKLYATGGGASSSVWLQIKADILNREIISLESKEVGACGTCMLVAVALGECSDLSDAKKRFVKPKDTYLSNSDCAAIYNANYERYKKLYNSIRPIIR